MPPRAYKIVPPSTGPIWDQINAMANGGLERRLSRLCDAMAVFEKNPRDSSAAYKVAPKGNGTIEVYLVPVNYDDAAVLLKVNHATNIITFVMLFEYFNETSWQYIDVAAETAINEENPEKKNEG
jgi:hypothetical protein